MRKVHKVIKVAKWKVTILEGGHWQKYEHAYSGRVYCKCGWSHKAMTERTGKNLLRIHKLGISPEFPKCTQEEKL